MKQLKITCTVSSLGQDLFSVSIRADKIKVWREFYVGDDIYFHDRTLSNGKENMD